jgi:hypothetical protein
MLIRWATESDLPAWYTLVTEVSEIFQQPADMGAELAAKSSGKGAVGRYEMLTAVDYMSDNNVGFFAFRGQKTASLGLPYRRSIAAKARATAC